MPNHSWIIKRANVKLLEPDGVLVDAVINCTYDFSSGAVPLLKSHTMFIKKYNYTFQRVFADYQIVEKVAQKDFTLSHYGIPEPDFDGSRRTNRVRYALMGSGILLIILAIWRMYKKHQKKN